MKRSDIAMIVLIASASALIAYFITQAIFGSVSQGTATVKTVDKIESTFQSPDPTIFNETAINPTVEAQIGTGTTSTTGSTTSQ